jgi:hypothetical protein
MTTSFCTSLYLSLTTLVAWSRENDTSFLSSNEKYSKIDGEAVGPSEQHWAWAAGSHFMHDDDRRCVTV